MAEEKTELDTSTGGAPQLRGEPRFRPLQNELTDLPNLITIARIGLIPLILVSIDNTSPHRSALAALIFAFAAATDALDGYLARRMGLVTVLGKFLDPLADKLIVLSTLVYLSAQGRAPAWLVVLLMSRELAITGLRAVASSRGLIIAAGAGGKIKTALQLVGIVFLLIYFPHRLLLFDIELDFQFVGINVLYLVMSLFSAAQYFQFFARAAAKQAEEMEAVGVTRATIKERLQSQKQAKRARRVRRRSAKRRLKASKRKGRRTPRGTRKSPKR